MAMGPQPHIHASEPRMSREASERLGKLNRGGEQKGEAECEVHTSWCRARGHLGRAMGDNPGLLLQYRDIREGVSWFHSL